MNEGLAGVLDALRCPVCAQPPALVGASVRCPAGHNFDVARQGYLNLLAGRGHTDTADTAPMVAARAEFLAAGHYAPLAQRIAETVSDAAKGGLVLDAGANLGYYLAGVLDAQPSARGLAMDLSAYALRRAARAHPRIGAIVWDVWRPWPVRDGCASVLLNVFAPRNGAEFRRVLADDGTLLVVTPGPDHLAELGERFGLLTVDPDKDRRLAASLDEHFVLADRQTCTIALTLSAPDAEHLVMMGPSAHHVPESGRSFEPATATGSFLLSRYRPRG